MTEAVYWSMLLHSSANSTIVLNRAGWLPFAIATVVVVLMLAAWNYISHRVFTRPSSWIALFLKAAGVSLVAICLLEPMREFTWPRPQENVVAVVLDASKSMTIGLTAAEQNDLRIRRLATDSEWQKSVAEDFDLRRYTFGRDASSVDDLKEVAFEERKSNLFGALGMIGDRMSKRPLVAIFAFTDGNATDIDALNSYLEQMQGRESLPRIYPVVLQSNDELTDLSIADVRVEVADFESAPIGLDVQVSGQHIAGQEVVFRVLEQAGVIVHEQRAALPADRDELRLPLRFTYPKSGVQQFVLQAYLASDTSAFEDGESTVEATLANNERHVVVNRESGPYRVLYVAGRPNWEFKFLRRAISLDREIDLVGLIRIAKKEAKFAFRDTKVKDSNSLFSGFEDNSDGASEQIDEPVFTRLGVRDAEELSKGFPDTARELYAYDMLVLDDLESEFFLPTQIQLINRFVSERGGTLLMLGGAESFRGRAFANGALSQLMPLYFDSQADIEPDANRDGLRITLTREGWLQPTFRIKETEELERTRLQGMPEFKSPSVASGVKPGAVVYIASEDQEIKPVFASQRFGKGKTAAFLLSDFWRWAMNNPETGKSTEEIGLFATERTASEEIGKTNPAFIAWRQLFRWLITDVPQRVELGTTRPAFDSEASAQQTIEVAVSDAEFNPLDNATVQLSVNGPGATEGEITATPSNQRAGVFLAETYPTQDGAYIVTATAKDSVGEQIASKQIGFVINESAEELKSLRPNYALLESLAKKTEGRVLHIDELESEANRLPELNMSQTIRRVEPLWHQTSLLLLAFVALLGEWGIRRWKGLP